MVQYPLPIHDRQTYVAAKLDGTVPDELGGLRVPVRGFGPRVERRAVLGPALGSGWGRR